MVQHIKANEPASLLLTLTPYKTAIHARITSDPEKDFPAFINSDIQHIGDDPRTVPGYWFLHVDYKHKKDIPELSSTDLLPKVIQALSRKVAVIKSGVPMIDVFFCRKQDLDAAQNYSRLSRDENGGVRRSLKFEYIFMYYNKRGCLTSLDSLF